jgi:hypothetical protein
MVSALAFLEFSLLQHMSWMFPLMLKARRTAPVQPGLERKTINI